MTAYVYNTMTKKREPFEPKEPGKLSMYACGLTVYDKSHIGHAMQAIIYDMIRNYFEFRGYEVTYVRNYTDVDDKIIERAALENKPALVYSQEMIDLSLKDMALLGVKPATIEPKVSEHIPEIIELIQKLIDKGHAYESQGDVYFEVRSFPKYGCLSNRDPEELRSGSRIEINQQKNDPLDFALWKRAKEGEVSWTSPWGEGRPGWHIECSAMAEKYLGREFDIHGGGRDLIFPHHENEIAQSCAAHDSCYARYWIHNGLILVDGQKMGKSKGNFYTIQDAVKAFHPEAIRYTILKSHYTANIDFCDSAFHDAYSRMLYFYNTFKRVEEIREQFPDAEATPPANITVPNIKDAFIEVMDDDFNTVAAIREINAGFKFINDLVAAKKPKMKQKAGVILAVADEIKTCLGILGLCQNPSKQALAEIQEYLIRARNIDPAEVEARLQERVAARENKEWQKADDIRESLIADGIAVMDTPQGTEWQVLPHKPKACDKEA
ncbi:cysteine--tRNA ligase [Acanthopleuribacter pedis]|uniref:Cysteine--tRNA ligase n=1 Tax=Acanthopleuribacter pedis TaxID=442870 RepID=A0A8J7Q3K1_9BACT|nr:cysteine--tRNA ligase [Acanthopleuribacter pedis]MBO1316996.1 cysteine--tRNA ligase [Acanthopleuribacter pedis]